LKRDRVKWNKRHSAKDPGQSLPGIVRNYIDRAPVGRALDIACGTGAVSLFLAERGYTVDAVDISDVALAVCAAQHPAIQGICADLDTFNLAVDRYCLITNIRYLNRRLFPQVTKALLPGGLLMFETYVKSREKEMDRGFKREYLLDEQELPHVFASLDILFYQELDSGCAQCPPRIASLVGVKP
jgi:SAM-dependent methyltransferase